MFFSSKSSSSSRCISRLLSRPAVDTCSNLEHSCQTLLTTNEEMMALVFAAGAVTTSSEQARSRSKITAPLAALTSIALGATFLPPLLSLLVPIVLWFSVFLAQSLYFRLSDARDLVEVKAAGDKGLGLFATSDLAQGQLIGQYAGERLSQAQFEERYPTQQGEYVWGILPGLYIDSSDNEKSNFARFINHASFPSVACNLMPKSWTLIPFLEAIYFLADRDIARGEELCVDYGPLYWQEGSRVL